MAPEPSATVSPPLHVGAAISPLAALSVVPTLLAGAIETVALFAFGSGAIGWPLLFAIHVGVVAALVACVRRAGQTRAGASMALLATVTVAAAGPIGAIAALLTLVLASRHAEDPGSLAEWYRRIALAGESDDTTRLCESVAIGRTASVGGLAPASFAAIMDAGTLADRQAVLGIVARRFHPDLLPVLKLALKSTEPVIRVQAAAVATRLRPDLRARIDGYATAAPPRSPDAARTAAAELRALTDSGLLDESDRIRADALASRLSATAAQAVRTRFLAVPALLQRRPVEELLIRERRFGELRVLRRVAVISDRGRFRVRRQQRSALPEAA